MSEQQFFGTDGIRGRVGGAVINPEFFLHLGWAAGKVLSEQGQATVLLGRDTRHSGVMLQSALSAGLTAAGVSVHMVGVLPTPAIAYLTRVLNYTAGAVISASHNDFRDNGIKFFNAQGMKLSDALELAIEAELHQAITIEDCRSLGAVSRFSDAANQYVDFCVNAFSDRLQLDSLKIVIDCAEGATYQVAPRIFQQLGAEIINIHDQPDGLNINDHCGATHVASLQRAVAEYQADLGIAFDGDGDRLMLVDHQGEVVDGDEVLCILAQQQQPPIGVVGTLMSNLGLEQALTGKGIDFERTNVGDRFVLERLLEKGWWLGGEASGHIVNLQLTTTGDGIISALQVLTVMCDTAQRLHHLKQVMIKRPQILINVPIQQTVDLNAFPGIQQAAIHAEQEMRGQGRVLLRASGTEACIRVMVEGNDEQQVRQHAESLALIVKNQLEH